MEEGYKHATVISVTNQKGGVGKTTTLFNLADAAAKDGARVLAIDLDPQGNLTSILAAEGSVEHDSVGIADAIAESLLERHGHMPLPPYITRPDATADRERYQTVFARRPGAVAAPTAGLHFDDALLATLRDRGVEFGHVTLHVGAGTFQPVRVENIAEHKMHSEWYHLPQSLADKIAATRARGNRVIAVGTTSMRALEAAARDAEAAGRPLGAASTETDIFITPGYRFRVVDRLVTNFHLPKSTLLMLVSSFAGYDHIMHAYRTAVEERYAFFSYGDAMLLTR